MDNASFHMIVSTLVVRVHRLNVLFSSAEQMRVVDYPPAKAAREMAGITAMCLALAVAYAVVDPQAIVERSVGRTIAVECSSDGSAWEIALLALKAAVVLAGIRLCFLTRNIWKEFNEARKTSFVLYNVALVETVHQALPHITTLHSVVVSFKLFKYFAIALSTIAFYVFPVFIRCDDAADDTPPSIRGSSGDTAKWSRSRSRSMHVRADRGAEAAPPSPNPASNADKEGASKSTTPFAQHTTPHTRLSVSHISSNSARGAGDVPPRKSVSLAYETDALLRVAHEDRE